MSSTTSPGPAASTLSRPWVPEGAKRDPAAQCYIDGPAMATHIKFFPPTLKEVPQSAIRDGSLPAIHAEHESSLPYAQDRTDPLLSQDQRAYAHINLPRDGSILEERFNVHYINATAADSTVQIVLRSAQDNTEVTVANDVSMHGNHVKKPLDRPEGLKPGTYGELLFEKLRVCAKTSLTTLLFRSSCQAAHERWRLPRGCQSIGYGDLAMDETTISWTLCDVTSSRRQSPLCPPASCITSFRCTIHRAAVQACHTR